MILFESIKEFESQNARLYNKSCILANAFINWPKEKESIEEYFSEAEKYLGCSLNVPRRVIEDLINDKLEQTTLWESHSLEHLIQLCDDDQDIVLDKVQGLLIEMFGDHGQLSKVFWEEK